LRGLRVPPAPLRRFRPCRSHFVELGLNLRDPLELNVGDLRETLGEIVEVGRRLPQLGARFL
jgi:hypothetical protein